VDDRARLSAAIASAQPGAEATRYAPALKVAATIAVESSRPRREVVLITDFQKNGWTPSDDQRLPAGTAFSPVSVGDGGTANLSVAPAVVRRGRFEGQERVTVTGGVTNRGTEPAIGVTLALEIDGRVAETARVDVAPQTSASHVFAPVTLTPAGLRGVVRVGDDRLAADNAYHFVLRETRPVAVLLATGGTRAADDTYLRRALAIGEAPRFEVNATAVDALTDEALAGAHVVIANDVPLGEAVIARLARFAEGGGGVLVIAGSRASWPPGTALPGTLGDPVDRSRATGRVGGVEYGHAVFAPFRAPRSGDFSSVRVYGYRRLTPAEDARVLARYDDGQPALVERTLGSGRILVWTSGVDLAWNDLALKPVFLPFVHQMVRALATFQERPAALTVGQVAALDRRQPGDPDRVAVDPAGRRTPIDPARGEALELPAPGFYEVRTGDADNRPVTVVAANVDFSESDLTGVDPDEVRTVVAGGDAAEATAAGVEPPRDEVTEQSQRLWWYLLFAGMLILIVESLVASRMSKAAA
jgi:hypothetical protein